MYRAAICFAPTPDSVLWQLGSRWLGRDAINGMTWDQPPIEGLDRATWERLVARPRQMGLHATLKPTFALRSGYTISDLEHRLAAFAQSQKPFFAPVLMVSNVGGFLGLVFTATCPQMADLAADCVQELDGFRAPPTAPSPEPFCTAQILTPRQLQLLDCWGYPFVFDEFRFHFTLTDQLDIRERTEVRELLARYTASICRDPLYVDSICLFLQANITDPFRLHQRFAFAS